MKCIISLVVTVFNKESTLRKCLNSIIENNLEDCEIILINDGSTDNSEKIILEYVEKYDNIFYYYHENLGLSKTRRDAINYANCKYIVFMDSDDSINKCLLSILKENIFKYNPDLIKFNLNEINNTKSKERYKTHYDILFSGKEALLNFSEYDIRYSIFSMYAIKKELFESVLPDFFDLYFYEDVANVPKIVFKA